MSKIPNLAYGQIVRALQRHEWVVVRHNGRHSCLRKDTSDDTLKLTIPAHRSIKRSTLAHILKQAKLSVDELTNLL